MNATAAATQYAAVGINTIALLPGSKDPLPGVTWKRKGNWHAAPDDANIAVRAGGPAKLAILDADSPETYQNQVAWLAGLGYQPGTYQEATTATPGHRQIFGTFAGGLDGHFRQWDGFGPGEFRYGPNAYTVAYPSVVNGHQYSDPGLLNGPLVIHLELADVRPLIKNPTDAQPEIKLPARAWRILSGDFSGYTSRSEAEQAVLTMMVNANMTYWQARKVFDEHSHGKYQELARDDPANAERWLHRSYDAAEVYAAKHLSPARQAAQDVIALATAQAWPGRTGAQDKQVFLAHCHYWAKSGRDIYGASVRELAQLAGCSTFTASKATHRLMAADLIHLEKPAVNTLEHPTSQLSTVYRINTDSVRKPNTPSPCDCEGVFDLETTESLPDAFRSRLGLGRVAFDVYRSLANGPLTAKDIVKATGRSKGAVSKALHRMERLTDAVTGEISGLVMYSSGDNSWARTDASLEAAARILGSDGAQARQAKQYAAEREAHRKAMQYHAKRKAQAG